VTRRRAWLKLTAVGAAVGGAAALAVVTTRRREPPGPIGQTGILGRNARLARLGARTTGGYAMHRARRVFATAERREVLDREHEIRSAEQVAAELGNMKGALMKLGQMVSYLDEGLPEHLRTALAQLQHDAPPMSGELAASMIEQELHRRPDELFAEWDPVPIAAASIGQVHRAITREGVAVAVKVQYPGVGQAIEADLGSVGLLFGGLGQVFPGLDSGPLVEELRLRLREELDYEREARNQQRFADYYEGHPFIHIPAVLPAYSSARVLTTELAEGVRFAEAETWSQDERNLAAETIFRFVFGSLYRLHLFNGDPHPGNYLFRPGGQVTFLDFGLVTPFGPEEVEHIRALIDSIVLDPDPIAFRHAVEQAGFLKPGAPITDAEVVDYFGHFYEYLQADRRSTLGHEFASENVRRVFDATGPHRDVMRHANVPPAFVIVQRINLGLFAVLAALGATANWRRLAEEMWPWVEGPPSTPLGEREHAWRQQTGRGTAVWNHWDETPDL
jgi:predicted unusual protein kinase regulating ubiquinone biosynthesis (AarF/ABC1/UbiB family)